MTLQDQYTETTNPALQARVQMAAASTAQAIGAEAANTPNHANRAQLASRVAQAPGQYTMPFTNMVCAEGITSASTDADIANMISAVWNTMAGPDLTLTVP